MSVEISPQTQARLADEARRQGISVDELVRRLIEEHAPIHPARTKPELPVWRLGGSAPLHRRDIYPDAL